MRASVFPYKKSSLKLGYTQEPRRWFMGKNSGFYIRLGSVATGFRPEIDGCWRPIASGVRVGVRLGVCG